jgi:hypothetical protein
MPKHSRLCLRHSTKEGRQLGHREPPGIRWESILQRVKETSSDETSRDTLSRDKWHKVSLPL